MSKIPLKEKIQFFQEIKSVSQFGFSISETLDQLSSVFFKKIRSGLKKGRRISELLREYNYEPEVVVLFAAGEQSSNILPAIEKILFLYEKRQQLWQKVIKTVTYPAVTILFALIIALVFMIFIMPQFNAIYSSFGLEQPGLFNFKINIVSSAFLLLLIAFVGWRWSEIKTRLFKKLKVFHNYYMLHLYNTLAVVAANNNDFYTSLKEIDFHSAYQQEFSRLLFLLKKGANLSVALQETGLIDQESCWALEKSELIDQTAQGLQTIARLLEEKFYLTLEKYFAWLEPLTIVFVGLFVGLLTIQIIKPIISLTSSLL